MIHKIRVEVHGDNLFSLPVANADLLTLVEVKNFLF
jgi:hypothetical protein